MEIDLLASPRTRAHPCAPPCRFCGSDGSEGLLRGAALSAERTLDLHHPIQRVGLWLVRPPSVSALRVVVSGDLINRGTIAPTAVRARSGPAEGSAWRGAALSTLDLAGTPGRHLHAGLSGLDRSLVALDLAGLCRAPDRGVIELRAVAEGVGCIVARTALSVREHTAPQWIEAYADFEHTHTHQGGARGGWTARSRCCEAWGSTRRACRCERPVPRAERLSSRRCAAEGAERRGLGRDPAADRARTVRVGAHRAGGRPERFESNHFPGEEGPSRGGGGGTLARCRGPLRRRRCALARRGRGALRLRRRGFCAGLVEIRGDLSPARSD